MDFVLSVLLSLFLGFLVHEATQYLNNIDRKLDLSPMIHALVAVFFGLKGICVSAIYIAIKAIIKHNN